jgi:hypothetical protein
LFQVATIAKSATVTMPGVSSFSEMVKNVRISLAPSMRAASSSSFGTDSSVYTQIRYRPNGLISEGMMIAHGVLVRPRLLNSRNVGTASAVPGTAIAPSTTAKYALRPGKPYFARPYPASVARSVAPPAPTTTYSRVLPSQRRKIPSR